MIVMDIRIDNFYAFNNFHMNMAYPKKILKSPLGNETLEGHPNFRYKKVNILMGANATGKTSFGKMMMEIFNFIVKKQYSGLTETINDVKKQAFFGIDYIASNDELTRVECTIAPLHSDNYENSDITVSVRTEKICEKDSYESCVKKIEEKEYIKSNSYIEELDKTEGLSWFFQYPSVRYENIISGKCTTSGKYNMVLEHILKALDPSIQKVDKSTEVSDAYIIRTSKKDIIIQKDGISDINFLSSGTLAGIEIANMLTAIIENYNSFYYCDEKFSFIHSDIEKAVLAVMIDSLGDNAQLFFTTHNTDIVDMPLPKHSFMFLTKDVNDESMPLKCICASDFLKRNTDSVKNAIENDLFSSAPGTELILDIMNL